MADKIELPKTAEKIIFMLNNAGYEAYAVGGCIRDMLMGNIPDDYDIATNALPDEIKAVFSGFKTIDTGIAHGTVTVIIDGFHAEVTTYRTDGKYTDNRHPDSVSFSKSIYDDLSRRDFTVNALAYDGKRMIDAFGGKEDIKNRIIRCVGNPLQRFTEDALRILRALRFSSVLNFKIEDNTKNAVFDCMPFLDNISKERVFSEIKKLVCGENSKEVLEQFRCAAEMIFTGISEYTQYQYETAVNMTAMSENDFCMRMAALMYFFPEDGALSALNRLKSSNKIKKDVTSYLKKTDCNMLKTTGQIQKYMFLNGGETLKNSLKMQRIYYLCTSDLSGAGVAENIIKAVDEIINLHLCFNISDLNISGRDIASSGLASGKEIGVMLKKLLFAVIDKRVENEKAALLKYAKIYLADKI